MGGDPAQANVTIGRFGHQLGNCVCANAMMRLWPQILKAGNLLKARAQIRDTWAELVAFCEEKSLTVPIQTEAKRRERTRRRAPARPQKRRKVAH